MFIDHSVYLLLGCVIRKRIWNSCLLYRGGHCFPLRLINDPLGVAANRTNKLMQFVGGNQIFLFFFFFFGFNKIWYTRTNIILSLYSLNVDEWWWPLEIYNGIWSLFFSFFFFLTLWKCSKKWNFVLEHHFFLNSFLYFLIVLDRNEIWRFWDVLIRNLF